MTCEDGRRPGSPTLAERASVQGARAFDQD
jgi:hypothetical protein